MAEDINIVREVRDEYLRRWRIAERKIITLQEERDKLQARLDDALKTLEPFEAVSQPGYAADSLRPRTVTVTEGDLCQAWQVLKIGSRWRPEGEE